MYYESQTPSDFNNMVEADFEKGMIVEGDLYANLGCFEENYRTKYGVKQGNSQYNYMIPVGETQYMGLLNNTVDLETALNQQADETFSLMLGETTDDPAPVHFKGRVVKMTDETKGYLRDYMLELGFTTEEVDDYILPYYIKCEIYGGGVWMALIGLVFFVIGVLSYVIPYMSARKKQDVIVANSNTSSSYNNTTEESFRNAFDEMDTISSTTSTAGLGAGLVDDAPKSGLSLK